MAIPRFRIKESLFAGAVYTLVAYVLSAFASLLFLLLYRAATQSQTYAHGGISIIDPVKSSVIPEPAMLLLLGTPVLSSHLTLRHRPPQSAETTGLY